MRKIVKLFKTKATSVDEANKTVEFQISDNQPDRMGEIVDQKSWNFKDYMANPILLWGHNPDEPENVLGTASSLEIAEDGSSTKARVKFDTDINPKAALVFNQVKRGTLRCVSVGFMNHDTDDNDGTPVLKNNDLLEISVVPIPANPRAIALDYKAGAITKKDAKWLMDSMAKEAEYIEEQLKNEDNPEEGEMNEHLTKSVNALMQAVTTLAAGQQKTNENIDRLVAMQEKALETKGTVTDELAEDQAMEDKWEKAQAACDIWWAFMDVYYDDDTPVEDFDKLLGETIELLGKVQNGEYTAPEGDGDEEEAGLRKALRNTDHAKLKAMVLAAVNKAAVATDEEEERATPSTDLPTAPEDTEWDADAAVASVKEWASDTEGNIDFAKYSRAFFWHDPENADQQGGYKLPYASVFDGELKAVWHGVAAAYGAMEGAQGGVELPEADREAVLSAIKKYYDKFGKEWPQSDNTAKGGEIDQSGAVEEVELDLDAELTPELEAKIERALSK